MTKSKLLLACLSVALACAPSPSARAADSKTIPPDNAAKILSSIKAPAGFDMTVYASPPDIDYPTSISAAPNGDLYVAIDEDGSLGKDPNRGKVVKCIDTDSDGKADQFITFAKMDHPRGVIWDAGRLFVLHPPFLSVYYDDNGDGVADRSEILVKGISTEESVKARGADHTTNGIRLGIDGWIYIAMGDFGALHAITKDGKETTIHGGGVCRIRPDGTSLERYNQGQRNIYDVAISPLMDIFTRDNTNDGDAWNDRLSFIIPTGHYGYPSLFRNFKGEFIDALIDFGGGSPCGSLFVDEPNLPGGLYTVEWGRNVVDHHELERTGAGYKLLGTKKLIDLPHGTDIDVDGQGRLYAASWANGGFSWSGPNVGYILRLVPKGVTPALFPNLQKTGDQQLLSYLNSPSAVCRQAVQREILRRGDKPRFSAGLEELALSDAPLPVRVAAIFTLQQLQPTKSADALVKISAKDDLREFALRALADRKADPSAPAKPFLDALSDPNPRVRLQAAWGLGRLNRTESAPALVPLVADTDPLVSHVAINALVTLNAIEPCLKAVDTSNPKVAPGTLQALQAMHDPAVVDGLVAKLGQIQDPTLRAPIFRALCRLCYREADWTGSWWGTRPDTSGPYFKTAEWAGTAKVKAALQSALSSEKPEVMRSLVVDMQKNKVDLPELMQVVAKAAATDPALKSVLVELLANRNDLKPEQVEILKSAAANVDEPIALRAKALRALMRNSRAPGALDATVEIFASVLAADKPDPVLSDVADEFTREPRLAQNLAYFTKLATSDTDAKRQVGYLVLVNLASNRLARANTKEAAAKAIEAGWDKPTTAASLLRAIGRTKADGYNDYIEASMTDPNANVVRAAAYAADRVHLKNAPKVNLQALIDIKTLGFDKTVELVLKEKGDPNIGRELFVRQGCVACHTVSPDESPKGPFLGGVSARYTKADLCESIMKPSAKIAQGFETQYFAVKGGDVLEGFVTRESGDEIELRNVAGIVTVIKTKDIKKRGKRDISVMPEGLVEKLTPQELASIIAYLNTLKGK
jgi:putative heme-binding domain-containing protein